MATRPTWIVAAPLARRARTTRFAQSPRIVLAARATLERAAAATACAMAMRRTLIVEAIVGGSVASTQLVLPPWIASAARVAPSMGDALLQLATMSFEMVMKRILIVVEHVARLQAGNATTHPCAKWMATV